MSLSLPIEFIVRKFYQYASFVKYNKRNNTYIACCPICREGNSWGKKKRLYLYLDTQTLNCFNCNKSWTASYWIKRLGQLSTTELIQEAFDDSEGSIGKGLISNKALEPSEEVEEPVELKDPLDLLDKEILNYYRDNKKIQLAVRYILQRRLNRAINRPSSLYFSLTDEIFKDRIIIPFQKDLHKFFQARSIHPHTNPKYLSSLNREKTLFHLDRLQPSLKYAFFLEGPVDAMFIQNGVSLAGLQFTQHQREISNIPLLEYEKIWILDNPYKDTSKGLRDKYMDLCSNNENIFIWPKEWKDYKDLNEYCCIQQVDQVEPQFILDHVYTGSKSLLKLKEIDFLLKTV